MELHGHGTREEITIGVVGSEDAVHRAMAVARDWGSPTWRLIPAVYEDEADAYSQAMRIAPRADVCMFAGPLPYEITLGHGGLPVPATYIPVGGSALYSALLRATLEKTFDPELITIDSVSLDEVRTTYREVGLDSSRIGVAPYVNTESAEGFLDFHRQRYDDEVTTGALTTVPTVAAALHEAGIPSLKMQPTAATIQHALNTAALRGSGAQLEESRIVTMVVRIPSGVVPEHAGPSNYWYQELKLAVQRELLRHARMMDATVLPRDERSYLVITTMGSLAVASNDLTVAPFLGSISAELTIDIELGIGLGRSTREAEFNAETAVDKASATGGQVAYLVGPRETVLQLPTDRTADTMTHLTTPTKDSKAIETLRELAAKLSAEGDSERIVDAERVSILLGVTLRTARRSLGALVDAGLAWPMPPARSSKAGRPPRPYQLLVEKLPDT
jgi:hypothetical protein